MPVLLALFSTILSLASAFPFAYLFERGNNTIWAPALFHTMGTRSQFFCHFRISCHDRRNGMDDALDDRGFIDVCFPETVV
jgi:hypothetical protein